MPITQLIKETKALLRWYLFLRYDCGLKYADKLSVKELRALLATLKSVK